MNHQHHDHIIVSSCHGIIVSSNHHDHTHRTTSYLVAAAWGETLRRAGRSSLKLRRVG